MTPTPVRPRTPPVMRQLRPLWATSGEGFSSPQRRPTHESIDILIAHQVEDVRDKQPVKRRYVDQVSVSLRPNTVRHIELDLRRFGTWLTNHHPDVACCADLERHHIEASHGRAKSAGRRYSTASSAGSTPRPHDPPARQDHPHKYNTERLMHRLGRRPPAQAEAEYYAHLPQPAG
jgi:hypothetical protein